MAFNNSVVWVDAGNRTSITLIRQDLNTQILKNDLAALSNAAWLNSWCGLVLVNGSPAPTAAQYPSVGQAAILVYQGADGTSARLTLPAPKASLFLADGVTIDSSTITTLTADMIAHGRTPSGSNIVAYQSGILQRPP